MASIQPGTRLGPYEITAVLGAGGMGEVYKATDTRLGRSVAIKVVAARDPDLDRRFQREAKALGSLSHPHICPIHDVGSVEGTSFLVMEFLDGETLSQRLHGGRLAFDKALEIAIQIADALDAAHRAGIVHRDLKPGNIMLTKSGAMLLDFGLARQAADAGDHLAAATTSASSLTEHGVLLGTFPYMAPEQVEGRPVDARTDIFALGSVLFEMIAGRRAFEGPTQASVMGAIVRDAPPAISTMRLNGAAQPSSAVLQHVDYTIRRCLEKDPDDRWQHTRDLMLHLRWIAGGGAEPLPSAPVTAYRAREAAAWIIAGIGIVAAIGFASSGVWRTAAPAPLARFSIDAPRETVFAPISSVAAPHPVISPDGRRVAFLAQSGTEPVRIWVRHLDALESRALPGTENARFPFWSPDGNQLGFFADGALLTIGASGGAAHRVAAAPAPEGGTWNRDGTILFAPGPNAGIFRVAAAGGTPAAVLTPSPERRSAPRRWPTFLPDGRRFLFHEGDSVLLGSLDSATVHSLTQSDSQAAYSPPGFLLFVRGRTLLAQRFDVNRGAVTGDPQTVAEGVNLALTNAAFSVSEIGTLVYRSAALLNRQLTWFDRTGASIGTAGGAHDFNGVHLSPDGQKVAYHRHDGRPDGDVWVIDLARDAGERLTVSAENLSPVWSPDGLRIAYASDRDSDVNNIWVKSYATASHDEAVLTSNVNKTPRSWSPDGRFIAYVSAGARGDIWVLPLEGSRMPLPFAQTEFDEGDPAFSPDGRWIAYHSDESGRNEVYLRPFPTGDGRWVVSTGGGATPKWRGDGQELFYQMNREVWAVAISLSASGPQIGKPHRLLDIGTGSAGWDVTRDGQRILVGRGVTDRSPGALTVTLNWTAALTPR